MFVSLSPFLRGLGALGVTSLVGCGATSASPDGSGGAAITTSGGASGSGGSGVSSPVPPASSGGTPNLGMGGAVSVLMGGREVALEAPDPNVVTFVNPEPPAFDPSFDQPGQTTEFARLASGWTFQGLELLAHQDFVWALARRENEAVLLVFDTQQCGGPIGQVRIPDEFVRDRRLVLGEEALLSCGGEECLLLDGVELDVRVALPLGSLSWLERNGATLCAGDGERLFCQRGDEVLSEPLFWQQETVARGRLADVGNCAVFESSQLCVNDGGLWEEVPLVIGPPPPPTCATLWHAGAFELTSGDLVESCTPKDGSALPIGETHSVCGTTESRQQLTNTSYFATCGCARVG